MADFHRLASLAERQLGLFTWEQALACGFDRSAVGQLCRERHAVRVARRVYRIAGTPKTWEQAALVAVLSAGPGAALSHRAAAALWGVPGFKQHGVEVAVDHGRNRRNGRLQIHGSLWLPPHHMTMRGPVPVVTPARMLCDVAGAIHPGKLARAVDNALALNLVTIEILVRTFEEWAKRGRAGSAAMRDVLEPRGVGYVAPVSELEARFLDLVVAAGLPLPERERPLGDNDAPIGRVEMVYPGARLLVELDGRRNHTALLDREADHQRDLRFAAAGWTVVRVTWRMLVTEPDTVVAMLRARLAALLPNSA